MITDKNSFLAGVQVGRRLRMWDASRVTPMPPEPYYIITEDGDPIVTEAGDKVISEEVIR